MENLSSNLLVRPGWQDSWIYIHCHSLQHLPLTKFRDLLYFQIMEPLWVLIISEVGLSICPLSVTVALLKASNTYCGFKSFWSQNLQNYKKVLHNMLYYNSQISGRGRKRFFLYNLIVPPPDIQSHRFSVPRFVIREVHIASTELLNIFLEIIPSYMHVSTHRWTKSLHYEAGVLTNGCWRNLAYFVLFPMLTLTEIHKWIQLKFINRFIWNSQIHLQKQNWGSLGFILSSLQI